MNKKSYPITKYENMKQALITIYFPVPVVEPVEEKPKVIRGYNESTHSWHCIGCGVDMGKTNSRQFCYKSYCPYESFE